ncbi:hypothetical protein DFP72DRAFT_1064604 [Ephemerocybe angulata]|uniref:Uncharacterized protein n=1 Tax=Ephemerocybe angulata TaxID=980116 RepID=A0A8H6I4H3_9AGAR|nr:hypothetical protein DFP72DRAFT_1064604 [Tulosesus angulatus]
MSANRNGRGLEYNILELFIIPYPISPSCDHHGSHRSTLSMGRDDPDLYAVRTLICGAGECKEKTSSLTAEQRAVFDSGLEVMVATIRAMQDAIGYDDYSTLVANSSSTSSTANDVAADSAAGTTDRVIAASSTPLANETAPAVPRAIDLTLSPAKATFVTFVKPTSVSASTMPGGSAAVASSSTAMSPAPPGTAWISEGVLHGPVNINQPPNPLKRDRSIIDLTISPYMSPDPKGKRARRF